MVGKIKMVKTGIVLVALLSFTSFAQEFEIKKENLTKQVMTYWDFNKTQPQSKGKYYKDQLGETTDKHGKWVYYNRLGEVEEVRNYYKDMLHGEVVMYYPNGKKRQLGYFKFNRQDSVYFEWNESGILMVEGEYDMDKPVNTWKNYYLDGRLKSEEIVKGGVNYVQSFYLPDSLHTQTLTDGNGEIVTYFTTGTVKEWYNYKDGLKDGKFEERSVYGYPKMKGTYKEGKRFGTWDYYYYGGEKEKTCNYTDDKLDGEYTYFYDFGEVKVNGRYKMGLKEGEWTWYTNQGTRGQQGTFKDDLQHGDWTYWHPTGQISYYAHYDRGLRTGTWTYFYVIGGKFKEGDFKNDLKSGVWKTWYEDGTLLMEGEYVEGKENGEWINYWPNGTVKNKANFKTGKLNGDWESYYPSGKTKLTGKYDNDLKVGEWIDYFENGKPKDVVTYKKFKIKSKMDYSIMKDFVMYESKKNGHSASYSAKDFRLTEEGDYKDGEKDGEWIAYHPGGKVPAVVSHYKEGSLHGVMKQYNKRGKLMQEMEFKDGLKHGKFIMYDKRGRVLKELKFEHGMQVIEGTTNSSGTFTPGR